MIATTETRPTIRGGATEPFTGAWIFVEGDRIVGTVESCCFYCAWMLGHPKWPDAEMGSMYNMGFIVKYVAERGQCSRLYWAERT